MSKPTLRRTPFVPIYEVLVAPSKMDGDDV